jgi:Kef-type K+ transport system membrane component KefB/predicted amino acid-binding ACT domain protein
MGLRTAEVKTPGVRVSVNELLFGILIVLVFAKIAAELAERVGVPAVVGEIVAGVLIGPSVLGWVEPNRTLETLAELGVILLLLEVGMEMNLGELRRVGRAALGVAIVGVVTPFALGTAAALALGLSSNEAVFLGAALTATSVGITARVFGDLRALASIEARTVLGAAVADDVLGLLILTVVTRLVTQGSVEVFDVVTLSVIAIGFIVVATAIGLRWAPPLFRVVARHSRGAGTLVAVALAFTLGLAELAHAVQLAPIIGAFVAGLALARTRQASRVRRELAPVGHLFVPVFFLQIGIDADLAQFARPSALAIAGVLLVVGIIGKLASVAGMFGAPGDRWLIGIGMVPRGEVGLIFATLGLREGVIAGDVYAALLMVVLATTLLTPAALRWRFERLRAGQGAPVDGIAEAVAAAARISSGEGTAADVERLEAISPGVRALDEASRRALLDLIRRGDRPTWRLSSVHGVLANALPELAEVVDARAGNARVDPLDAFVWPRAEQLRSRGSTPIEVLVVAIALDITEGDTDLAADLAARTATRLALDSDRARRVARDAELLPAVARRPDGLDEATVRTLASHVVTVDALDDLISITRSDVPPEEWVVDRIDVLVRLAQQVLTDDTTEGTRLADRHRHDIQVLLGEAPSGADLERLAAAPLDYLSRLPASAIARHLRLVDRHLGRDDVIVEVSKIAHRRATIDVVARDRIGLLAREARVLSEFRCDVVAASVVTWFDSRALASFDVSAAAIPDADALARRIRELFALPLSATGLLDASVDWDDHGSPWHTRAVVRGVDRLGALAAITTAFAGARVNVHSASIGIDDGGVADAFELSDNRGQKLTVATKARVERLLQEGSISAARGPRRRVRA